MICAPHDTMQTGASYLGSCEGQTNDLFVGCIAWNSWMDCRARVFTLRDATLDDRRSLCHSRLQRTLPWIAVNVRDENFTLNVTKQSSVSCEVNAIV